MLGLINSPLVIKISNFQVFGSGHKTMEIFIWLSAGQWLKPWLGGCNEAVDPNDDGYYVQPEYGCTPYGACVTPTCPSHMK